MNKTHSFLALLLIMLLLTNMNCKKEDSCRNCNDTNKAPIAVAGSDQAISLPLDSVLLDGSSSRDPDGSITKWLWKKISGPSSFTISSEISAKTVVKYLAAGSYNFELKVTDNKGLTAMDTIQVTVNDPGQVNRPPVANAGPDQSITLPVNSVTLDGSASNDPDNNIASYTWSKISGPSSFTIINAVAIQTQVTNLVLGIYQFELNVTDSGGLSAIDTIQVTVSDHGQANQPPIANAGTDQTITLPANTVNLDGSTSTDPDNNIASYAWSKISGPSSFNIINVVAVQTQVTNLVQGVYQFELKVTDAGGLIGQDTAMITVNQAPNTSPVDIYVAGGSSQGPKFWKNGQAVSLNGSGNMAGSSIAVVNGNIHVTGTQLGLTWNEESGAYWRNGQAMLTIDSGSFYQLVVANNDVYVAGYEYNENNISVAKYWKNGMAVSLTDGARNAYALGITVIGSDVYVAGAEDGVAKYWKNGLAVILPNGTYATSIVAAGSDIYVAGQDGYVAKYWKNGLPIPLTNGTTTAYANSICVAGNDVYVAGWEGDYYSPLAKYWKNGQAVTLTNGTQPSFAWGITVFGNDVYVVGGIGPWSNSVATIWKNGQPASLPNGTVARGIAVIPQ